MKVAVVFNGLSSIEVEEVRKNVVRIPEVFSRLRQAQAILDNSEAPRFDLAQYMNSEDPLFTDHLQLKTLAASIVQIGLYDRYFKVSGTPDFLVGQVAGGSAVRVAAGQVSFESFVLQSMGCESLKHWPLSVVNEETLLTGIPLSEYGIFVRSDENEEVFHEDAGQAKKSFEDIVTYLVEDLRAEKLVSVGPGPFTLQNDQIDLSLRDIQVLESIDLDPLLTWFWRRAPGV